MKLELRSRGIRSTPSLAVELEQSMRSTLARLSHAVRLVNVHLVDINGPRGGTDIRCSIRAELVSGDSLVIQELGRDPFSAVATAAQRVRRNVARRLGRLHARRRGRR